MFDISEHMCYNNIKQVFGGGTMELTADIFSKLEILSDAAKYDVACTSSGSSRRGVKGSMGNAASLRTEGVSHC